MAQFPILRTDRLTMRQLKPDDDQGVFALRSNTEINKYLDRKRSKTIDDARDFINMILDKVGNGEAFFWAITLTETMEFAGTVCLFNFSEGNKKCEIGYELLTNYQGRGIMKEAVSKVLEFAFNNLDVKTIMADTHKDNQRSVGLLHKFNFRRSSVPESSASEFEVFTLNK